MLEDRLNPGTNEICSWSDWKGQGENTNDRVVLVQPLRIVEWESSCTFTSIKYGKPLTPQYRDSFPVTIDQTCEGEGMQSKMTAVWDIRYIAGRVLWCM
jgi:hypothetical protein